MKEIKLRDGYKIARPDDKNFDLWHFENCTKIKTMEDGEKVKYEVDDYAFKGHYGTLKSLLYGMIQHKCHTEDVDSLKELVSIAKKTSEKITYDDIVKANQEWLESEPK